jgi:hypothetical protein
MPKLQDDRARRFAWRMAVTLIVLFASTARAQLNPPAFNVRNFGAIGRKSDSARAAIQKAVDACAVAGGGRVVLTAGEYTSGTIHLRNHVTLEIEAGATLYASEEDREYDKPALIYGEDLQNISIQGRGTIDGQGDYFSKAGPDDDINIHDNRVLAQAAGLPLVRSYPKGYGVKTVYPHLVFLVRCKDVSISGLSFLRSPSWTIYPYACERLLIDGIYVHTDQTMGVWADGIDPDGCKDVHISNSTIETGDDAIVLYSFNISGPALPCENITITNCRLSSASCALKFCDCNINCIRNVTVDNCVITQSNRGIAFMITMGGYVENVVLSNLVVNCQRYSWYWWGNGDPIYFMIERLGERTGHPQPNEPPAGSIRNVIIRNVIAHGRGSCLITGHPTSWLTNISLENIKLFLSTDPAAGYDKAVHAMQFRYARNLTVKDLEVTWEKPESAKWRSALYLQDISGLRLDNFSGGPAQSITVTPAVVLGNVQGATIRNSKVQAGTEVFLSVKGAKSQGVYLVGNELHEAKTPYQTATDVQDGVLKSSDNF